MKNRIIITLVVSPFIAIFIFYSNYWQTFAFHEETGFHEHGISNFFLVKFFLANWPSMLFGLWPGNDIYSICENYLETSYIPPFALLVNIPGWALVGLSIGIIVSLILIIVSRKHAKKQQT
jgi:hypothetical protein